MQESTSGIGSDLSSSSGSMQNLPKKFGLFSSKRFKNPSENSRKLTKSTGSLEEIKSMRRKISSTSDQRKSEFFVTSPITTWPTCDLVLVEKDHVTLDREYKLCDVSSSLYSKGFQLRPQGVTFAGRLEQRPAVRFSQISGNEFSENCSRLYRFGRNCSPITRNTTTSDKTRAENFL